VTLNLIPEGEIIGIGCVIMAQLRSLINSEDWEVACPFSLLNWNKPFDI
jgi:hypothetical protein